MTDQINGKSLYHIFSNNLQTGKSVRLTGYPMTHAECEIMASKNTSYSWRRLDFVPVPTGTGKVTDKVLEMAASVLNQVAQGKMYDERAIIEARNVLISLSARCSSALKSIDAALAGEPGSNLGDAAVLMSAVASMYRDRVGLLSHVEASLNPPPKGNGAEG